MTTATTPMAMAPLMHAAPRAVSAQYMRGVTAQCAELLVLLCSLLPSPLVTHSRHGCAGGLFANSSQLRARGGQHARRPLWLPGLLNHVRCCAGTVVPAVPAPGKKQKCCDPLTTNPYTDTNGDGQCCPKGAWADCLAGRIGAAAGGVGAGCLLRGPPVVQPSHPAAQHACHCPACRVPAVRPTTLPLLHPACLPACCSQ